MDQEKVLSSLEHWSTTHSSVTAASKQRLGMLGQAGQHRYFRCCSIFVGSRDSRRVNIVEPRTTAELGPSLHVFMAVRLPEAEMIKLPFIIDSGSSDHLVDAGILPPHYKISEHTMIMTLGLTLLVLALSSSWGLGTVRYGTSSKVSLVSRNVLTFVSFLFQALGSSTCFTGSGRQARNDTD